MKKKIKIFFRTRRRIFFIFYGPDFNLKKAKIFFIKFSARAVSGKPGLPETGETKKSCENQLVKIS